MKHTMMVLLVAVTLLTATGVATLAAYGTNGGDDARPAGVDATPTDVSHWTAAESTVDVSEPEVDDEAIAGSKPGVGYGSDWPKPIPKLAGDSGPGTELMIAGGRGGIFGDC